MVHLISQASRYDFSQRERAKTISRVRHEVDLLAGNISPDEMQATNGVFSSLDIAASVIRRRNAAIR